MEPYENFNQIQNIRDAFEEMLKELSKNELNELEDLVVNNESHNFLLDIIRGRA